MKISFVIAALCVFTLSMPLVAQESARQDFDDFLRGVGGSMDKRTYLGRR